MNKETYLVLKYYPYSRYSSSPNEILYSLERAVEYIEYQKIKYPMCRFEICHSKDGIITKL